jgi:hypothetical protein
MTLKPLPNVKIELFTGDPLYFLFDVDNGEYRYDYYPDGGHWDTRADSKDYDRADAFRLHSNELTDYLEDQARYILERFGQVLRDEFQFGYVDTIRLTEEIHYGV